MYSSISDLTKDQDQNLIIDCVNDENRSYDAIILDPDDANYDAADLAVIRINEQITAADDEIDTYLRKRYSLPLATVPGRIKQISKDIAIYNLYKRRYLNEIPDSIANIYKMRIAELKSIANGSVDLGIEEDSSLPAPVEYKKNKTSSDKIFTDDILDNF